MEEENLYEITVTVQHVEQFDLETESAENAEEKAEFFVKDDISRGVVDVSAFDIEAEAELVEEV